MLVELSIWDFAIIDELRISFEPGLNALTGETGAGKSIIIDALGAVLGERVTSDVVRTGRRAARVEAIFDTAALNFQSAFASFAAEYDLEPDEPSLILAREISAGGRSTARINGRAVTVGALARLGGLLVDIHGQSDHLSLLRPSEHLVLLDRFAGTTQARDDVGRAVRDLRELNNRIDAIERGAREREQRIDLLRFQAEEIADAALTPGEDLGLEAERTVLMNAGKLAEDAAGVHAILSAGDADDAATVLALITRASSLLDGVSALDPSMGPTAERLREMRYLLQDVNAEVRDYADRIEVEPERLTDVDERLELIRTLKRKYGSTIEEIIAHGDEAAAELDTLVGGESDTETLRARASALKENLGALAAELSRQRRDAAAGLSAGVEAAIAELNMGRARFAVKIEQEDRADGVPFPVGDENRLVDVDETGADRVEFLLAANPGEVPKPLARVASGGEMARLMLALKSILSGADATPTLVFDEVDVGVGGRSGQVVGEKLWGLTAGHQVIVISHLPQIAAFAEVHFRITKGERDGRTTTDVCAVEGAARIDEIAAMLDGVPVTTAARKSAVEMVGRAKRGRIAWPTGTWPSMRIGRPAGCRILGAIAARPASCVPRTPVTDPHRPMETTDARNQHEDDPTDAEPPAEDPGGVGGDNGGGHLRRRRRQGDGDGAAGVCRHQDRPERGRSRRRRDARGSDHGRGEGRDGASGHARRRQDERAYRRHEDSGTDLAAGRYRAWRGGHVAAQGPAPRALPRRCRPVAEAASVRLLRLDRSPPRRGHRAPLHRLRPAGAAAPAGARTQAQDVRHSRSRPRVIERRSGNRRRSGRDLRCRLSPATLGIRA